VSDYKWTEIGADLVEDGDGHKIEFYKRESPVSDFEAFNGPVRPVAIPDGWIKRLQDAMEGELDGLSCDDETACAILRYVLSGEDAA
jgi:hypothetical protein